MDYKTAMQHIRAMAGAGSRQGQVAVFFDHGGQTINFFHVGAGNKWDCAYNMPCDVIRLDDNGTAVAWMNNPFFIRSLIDILTEMMDITEAPHA